MTPGHQLLISLATIVLSGVMSAAVTYQLNKRREEKLLRRQKLELLYLSYMKFCARLSSVQIAYLSGITGKIPLDQVNDMILGKTDTEERPHDTAQMLVAIYFPEMKPFLTRLVSARDMAAEAFMDYKKAFPNWDRQGLHDRLRLAMKEQDVVEQEFIQAVHDEGRRIESV